jgi:hypothetical protein
MARRNQLQGKVLAGAEARHLLKLDTTSMAPSDAASAIAEWSKSIHL